MSLTTLREALAHASQHNYGIGAFNFTDEHTFFGILETAIAEKSPVILQIAEKHLKLIHIDHQIYSFRHAAEAAPVPVVIHLDHASTFETIQHVCEIGFTSVMYDGSALPLEENIANTKRVVDMAHPMGISVEAELGHVGGATDEVNGPTLSGMHYTDPALVPDFLKRTGIDALAVAVGTVHGLVKIPAALRFDILQQIRQTTGLPLVLHGGSGLSDDEFREAVANGIRKINFHSAVSKACVDAIRATLEAKPDLKRYQELNMIIEGAVRDQASHYMRVWGSSGKAE